MKDDLEKEARTLHTSNVLSLTSGAVKELLPLLVVVFKNELPNGGKRMVIGLVWPDDDSKEKATKQIGTLFGPMRQYIDLMVFSSEMWFTVFDKKHMKDVETAPRPSQSPDKKEGVMTSAFTPDLKNIYTITQEITRIGNKVTFEDESIINEGDQQAYILERMLGIYGN